MGRKLTGQCSHCGDDAHPNGNVFRLMTADDFADQTFSTHTAPAGAKVVKVCNNCDYPVVYHVRMSAKRAELIRIFDKMSALPD